MPKVTGTEMVKNLHAARMNLPVIMATALFPQLEFILRPWLEAVPTLLKPFGAAELLSTVKRVLNVSDSVHEPIAPRKTDKARLKHGSSRVAHFGIEK